MKATFKDIKTGKLLGETEDFEISKDFEITISDMNEWCDHLLNEFSRETNFPKESIRITIINHKQ